MFRFSLIPIHILGKKPNAAIYKFEQVPCEHDILKLKNGMARCVAGRL